VRRARDGDGRADVCGRTRVDVTRVRITEAGRLIIAAHKTYEFRPELYWHLTPARGANLLNQVHVGKGIIHSMTAIRRTPGLSQAVTRYGVFGNAEKEDAWERARQAVDKNLPTRQHDLFLFDDKAMADRARQTWFPNEDRLLIDARIAVGSRIHRADSRWLDCGPPQWGENAERYWRGEMTDEPFPEIVVDGAVYFPGWETASFGVGAGLV
jgi:hypothetical protein